MDHLNSSLLESELNSSKISNSTEINEPLILSPKDLTLVRENLFYAMDDSISVSTETQSADNSQINNEMDSSNMSKDVSSSFDETMIPVEEVAPKPRRGRKSIVPQQAKEETTVVVEKKTRKPPRRMSRGNQVDDSTLNKPTKARGGTKPILSSIEENGQDKTVKNPARVTTRKNSKNGTEDTKENDGVNKEEGKKKAPPSKASKPKNKVTKKDIANLQKGIHNLSTHEEENSILDDTYTETLVENVSFNKETLKVESTNETRDPSPIVSVTEKTNVENKKERRRTYVIQLEMPEEDEQHAPEVEVNPVTIKQEKPEKSPSMALPTIKNDRDKVQVMSHVEKNAGFWKTKESSKEGLIARKREIKRINEEIKKLKKLKKRLKKEMEALKYKIKKPNPKYKKQGRRGRYQSDSDSSTTSSSSSFTSSSYTSSSSSSSSYSYERKVKKRR